MLRYIQVWHDIDKSMRYWDRFIHGMHYWYRVTLWQATLFIGMIWNFRNIRARGWQRLADFLVTVGFGFLCVAPGLT